MSYTQPGIVSWSCHGIERYAIISFLCWRNKKRDEVRDQWIHLKVQEFGWDNTIRLQKEKEERNEVNA